MQTKQLSLMGLLNDWSELSVKHTDLFMQEREIRQEELSIEHQIKTLAEQIGVYLNAELEPLPWEKEKFDSEFKRIKHDSK